MILSEDVENADDANDEDDEDDVRLYVDDDDNFGDFD